MPVELRKRKAPAPAPEPPAPKKTSKVAKAAPKVASKAKAAVASKPAATNGAAKASKADKAGRPAVGDVITLDGFGGDVETNDGTKTTLKALVDESKSGVVLFTYPKAMTPGCTTQVCLFRDNYTPFTAGGLAIYGLSTDNSKSNTKFKEKEKLPYPLICDPSATLIAAIGLKKQPKGTQRGVFVVDKAGKVLLAEPGSPAGTVAAVKKLVEGLGDGEAGEAKAEEKEADKPEEAEEEAEEEAKDEAKEEAKEETNGEKKE
ncbi:AhpC-TSA-domain-containing protein [Thozetella sp. PMI_491]|nr:AhpC-TSA-domain-containing protein [Thozetella sp. PMI_491]